MNSIDKKWLKRVKEGIEPEKNISDYSNALSDNYRRSALIELVMEYVTLYEIWKENINPYIDVADEECECIHTAVKELACGHGINTMIDGFVGVRDTIIKKMQVVTAYVDRFLVYEYVLNRIEFRYTMNDQERREELDSWNQEQYAGELLGYIFEYEDNVVVNDRLHEVLEQLPVRMARSKFLDMVKNSLKMYKNTNSHSLDGYVYMLRTSAMIYEPDEMAVYFTEFKELLDELREVEFADINEEYFRILQEKICQASLKLQDISDVYMVMQKLVNMLYAYALNSAGNDADETGLGDTAICMNILQQLNKAFENESDGIDAGELLSGLEGSMEQLYDDKVLLESILDDVSLGFGTIINGLKLDEQFESYRISQNLFSTSLFAELQEPEDVPVTDEYLDEVSDALTVDLINVIRDNKRPVVRALIASVISKLPTFFGTSQEVMEYIQNAFAQCNDDVELIASIRLLDELTEV